MLADLVDHVIGVDPAKSRFSAVIVDSVTKGELAHREFAATLAGYRAAMVWADEEGTVSESRVWAIEGTGSYGSGLTQVLGRSSEWVIEFGHPKKGPSLDGTKTDRLDAARAGREALGYDMWAQPRARGSREGLRVLLMARDGAQKSRTQAINELKNAVLTAPVELRADLDGLKSPALVKRCAAFRPGAHSCGEVAGTKTAMRSLARRIQTLTAEAAELEAPMLTLINKLAPQLLAQFGIGPICAARFIVAWSHKGRFRSPAAFCRFAGVSPIEATTGGADIVRHRLNLKGDRSLNMAIHTVAVTRIRDEPRTQNFIADQRARGKSKREARRCLKRYIARSIYRLLENPPH